MSKAKFYGDQTAQSLKTHAFSGSPLHRYPEYVRALILVKKAAAQANADAGVLDAPTLKQILKGCEDLQDGKNAAERFVADVYQGGGGIAVHMNINEALSASAGLSSDHRQHVSASQSTADVCATALRMALWRLGQNLLLSLQQLTHILADKSEQFKDQGFMARTCMQDAMPTGFATFFAAWRMALERVHASMGERLDQLLIVNLGGTVIGSGDGAPEAYRRSVLTHLCEDSGLRLTRRSDLFDAAQFSDDLHTLSSELVVLTQILLKISRDTRLLSSGPQAGFAELAIPKVVQGSAFFSAKNNPTLAETLIQACMLVAGRHHSLTSVLSQSELNLNVFEPMMGVLLYESLAMLSPAIDQFGQHCLAGIGLGSKGFKHV